MWGACMTQTALFGSRQSLIQNVRKKLQSGQLAFEAGVHWSLAFESVILKEPICSMVFNAQRHL